MEELLHIDSTSGAIYEQVYNQIIQLIAAGILKNGDCLSSVRATAKELGVNPNTIQRAYNDLERDGIIRTVVGKGCFISAQNKALDQLTGKAEETLENAIIMCKKAGLNNDNIYTLLSKILERIEVTES